MGEFLCGFDHHIAPQLAGFKDIGLIDRAQLLAAGHCGFETDARNAADFILIIRHDVIAFPLAINGLAHALFTEIDVTVQFADNHHVDLTRNFRAQRRGIGQFGEQRRRTKVGEKLQLLAQA